MATHRHARATMTEGSCAAGREWSAQRRNASDSQLAVDCLRHGHGSWWPLAAESQTEPYLLDPRLQLNREARHWWGVCDRDLSSNGTIPNSTTQLTRDRPPRPAVLHEWFPEGEGCSALRKGRAALLEQSSLACSFCSQYAGHSILFVGDSVQGELFLSFCSLLGVIRVHVNEGNAQCRR